MKTLKFLIVGTAISVALSGCVSSSGNINSSIPASSCSVGH